jgi:hypothetical protein
MDTTGLQDLANSSPDASRLNFRNRAYQRGDVISAVPPARIDNHRMAFGRVCATIGTLGSL